ncbi:MAG: hypothetical protein QXI33_00570 [Candidatus Pacearchaeota archaeon]
MNFIIMSDVDDIMKKYSSKISKSFNEEYVSGDVSKEYLTFKEDMMPSQTRFEKFARAFSFVDIKLTEKDRTRIQKYLDMAHLDLTPGQVVAYAFFSAFLIILIGILISLGVFYYSGEFPTPVAIFLGLMVITSMFVFYYIYSSPQRLANIWRLRAGSQMVPCILYVVVYMKHTSNLERAIAFAAKHVQPPLSLDLKKIFYDVETGKFSSIKESLDNYLKTWENDSLEFVEAFHLIESSLYEPSDSRRILTLEKALQVILDGVYENMLSFSREVRSPLTNVYMLGVVLPTLGLALLPLASTLLGGAILPYHVFILFNLIVPFFVFYLTNSVLLKRPLGHGETEILELNPQYYLYKSKKPYVIAFIICFPLFLLGLTPFLFQNQFFLEQTGLKSDYDLSEFGLGFLEGIKLFDFKRAPESQEIVGPFGIGALLFGIFIPLSIALFFSLSYRLKTKKLIVARNDTKQLEMEFTNSLFQLGNRIGDGLPAEIAFSRVAESTRGQKTEEFFRKVSINLHQVGMSLDEAIFNKQRGAVIFFPSSLIATSMKILLESVKKGLKIAAQSLMSISEYMKNINKVEQRLKDLLAEVVSDMKSNIVFLAPLLSGIVVGLSSMITLILNKLTTIFTQAISSGSSPEFGIGNIGDLLNLFRIYEMIPPYYIQVAIGIYMIQITFILTNVLTIIDSGDDRLQKTYSISKNLLTGMVFYLVVTLISVITLSLLAAFALQGVTA